MVGLDEGAVWQDYAYLAAVAAASSRSGSKPAVIAIAPSGEIGREVADYLGRYQPREIFALGLAAGATAPKGRTWTALRAASAEAAACDLATRFWTKCPRAVVCREDDYASALLAASLAARLGCPLLYCGAEGPSAETLSALDSLGIQAVLAVGKAAPGPLGKRPKPVRLMSAVEVAGWLKESGLACDYLAIANPYDRANTLKRKLSLIAPLLAAARGGLVVPLDYASRWRTSHEAKETKGDRPLGLPKGDEPFYAGTATLGGKKVPFALVRAAGGREGGKGGPTLWRIYLDLDGDKKLTGPGEGPWFSADTVSVGGQTYTLVPSGPDRRRRKKPVALETCTPTAAEIQDRLRTVWTALGHVPSDLCIVGHPDAIPFWMVLDSPKGEGFVESDVPYANTDADPFYEINVGRVIAENAHFATLHASRIVTYPLLLNPRWSHSVGFARWEDSLGPQFANVGFHTQYLHTKHDRPEAKTESKPLAPGAKRGRIKREGTFHAHSPLTNVSAIVHGAHSWFMGLGETYTVDATVVLSPCVVESAGCGPTALHADRKFISVVSRLFRNGAVAFHGNAVPSPAPHQELRYGFWASVLGGRTLGAAHRDALNRKMLTVLETGQLERGGVDRRTLIARHLYGDPAFRMHVPDPRRIAPVRAEADGDRLTVLGPERWYVCQIRVPEDWKRWADKPLYVLRAPGIYIRAQWCGEQYDREEIYADVAYTTRRTVKSIRQETALPKPLGWDGKHYVDENADGTRTCRWRIRMADFDQIQGKIRSKADRIDYRLEY